MALFNPIKGAASWFVSKQITHGVALLVLGISLSFNNLYGQDKDFNYLKNGVSFTLPGDWKTISDEPLPDRGYYFSAESTGKNNTGLFNLVTINQMENPV